MTWGSTIGEIEVLLLGIERSKQGIRFTSMQLPRSQKRWELRLFRKGHW